MSNHVNIDVITSPGEIFKALQVSKSNETIIGINSTLLGEGTFLLSVSDIILLDELDSVTIVFKSYDVTGYFLSTNVLKLNQIKSVCPLTSKFQNPYLKNLSHHP